MWDSDKEYAPGDAVIDTSGLAGWLAIEPSRGVRPSFTGEGQRVWVMVWSSCGPGHVGVASTPACSYSLDTDHREAYRPRHDIK